MKHNKNILRAVLLLLLVIVAPEARAQQLMTANGDGTYTIIMPAGDVTVTADVKKLLANNDITVTIPSQTWTGSELTPVITVKDGETVLTENTDYTVTAPSGPIQDSGNYTYTITGQGNYAGSREAMFTIADQLITADGQTISDATTWKKGVVSITGNSTVTFSERITISGTVTLNLGEGATLIAPKGIEVDKGNTLTIEGNGKLNATADKFYAAIGRGFHDSTSGTSGTININGGTITATGGRFAAAIGGGYEGVSGTINISGGTIVATGGYCAAGIGGGTFAACGVVNISGGQVTANGDRASGIGPGFDAGTSGTVTLGWTTESDGILASNYNDVETLRVADGKAFTASTGNIYIGTLDDDQRAEFAGKTLKPVICTGVTLTKESQGITATIDGTSTATINIPTAVTVDNVTYNRTFTVGKASTVMLPFNYTCNGSEGGTFYRFVGVEKEENQPWVATMQETGNDANNEGTLIANTPYLFMPAATTMTFPNIPNGGVRLFTRGYDGGTKVTEYDGYELHGTYTEKVWEENDPEIGKAYLIGDGGELIPVTAGTRIRPTECYVLQKKFVYGPLTIIEDENGKNVIINGSSVEDIVNCPEFTAQKVTYTRTFTTPKATIVLPFAVSQTDAAAAGTFYKFYDVSSEFHVQMQEVTDGLEAGVPYIVVPKNTTDPVTFETTTSVAFPLTEPSEFTGNSAKWTFNGRYSTKIFNTLDANELVYFFAANEQDNAKLGDFVKVAASETTRILPFRAYIRCANKTALTRGNGVTRGFPTTLPVYAIGNDGNETTQIGTITIEMDDDDWYSLDGRKLSGKPNKKGLYIHKGKIVLF